MAKELLLSVIVATVGRDEEIAHFLKSIVTISTIDDIELIIVDQNEDNRLVPIIQQYNNQVKIVHLKCRKKHANKARNYGASFASGKWLGFADDDCTYQVKTFSEFQRIIIEQQPDIILGGVVDFENHYIGRANQKQTVITKRNVLGKVFEANMYIEKSVFNRIGGFCEDFGPGSSYFAAEGLELLFRAMKQNYKIYYNHRLLVNHPRKIPPYNQYAMTTSFQHSFATGAVLAKFLSAGTMYVLLKMILFHWVKLAVFSGLRRKYVFQAYKGTINGFITYLMRKRRL